jgi:hypothetical protein
MKGETKAGRYRGDEDVFRTFVLEVVQLRAVVRDDREARAPLGH